MKTDSDLYKFLYDAMWAAVAFLFILMIADCYGAHFRVSLFSVEVGKPTAEAKP